MKQKRLLKTLIITILSIITTILVVAIVLTTRYFLIDITSGNKEQALTIMISLWSFIVMSILLITLLGSRHKDVIKEMLGYKTNCDCSNEEE